MKQLSWILMAAVMAVVAGCGYKLAGGGYLNEDVARVAVAVFENNSSESRAGISFTNELVTEITQKSDTEVVDQSKTTRVITGTIRSITFSTLSRSSTEDVTERQVTAVVDVKLSGPDGEILWSVSGFSAKESYTVSDDTVDDEANKSDAVDTIAERVAERLVSQMLSNF
ncbi:MAG: LPS assembly lipoprotein LptE [Desulfobacterales bacterium]|nr:LPS assembly lipoprotein LptE [Desulfobacterales bacterium]